MKSQSTFTVLLMVGLALFITRIGFAEETLEAFGDKMGRSYHADFYDGESCDSCHEDSEPTTFPPDFICLDCHDGQDLVETTSRSGDEKWQNPHNNMHYGRDVPCMECHGEHRESKLLCGGCHSFDYVSFKE